MPALPFGTSYARRPRMICAATDGVPKQDTNSVDLHMVLPNPISRLGHSTFEYANSRYLIFEPVLRTTFYLSARDVFIALHSCLLGVEDGYPDSDRWMYLAAAFAFHEEELLLATSFIHKFKFPKIWIRDHGTFLVSGRTLTDWAKSLHLSRERFFTRPRGDGFKSYVGQMHRLNWWTQQGIFITQKGRLGLMPPQTKRGDRLCLLKAFRNIVILRPWDDGYKIVGYADIGGMIDGDMDHLLEGDSLECIRIY